jgi:hypothetical protein
VVLRSFRIWLSARCIAAGVTAADGRPRTTRKILFLSNKIGQRKYTCGITFWAPLVLLRGGRARRPLHCYNFLCIGHPRWISNHSWFIRQSSLEMTSRDI